MWVWILIEINIQSVQCVHHSFEWPAPCLAWPSQPTMLEWCTCWTWSTSTPSSGPTLPWPLLETRKQPCSHLNCLCLVSLILTTFPLFQALAASSLTWNYINLTLLLVLGEQVHQGDQLELLDFSQGPAISHPQPPKSSEHCWAEVPRDEDWDTAILA